MFIYLNGLLLGLSLIIALGPQNVFLIKQGAQNNHAILSATICFICDLILICSSIAGLHKLLLIRPVLQIWMMVLGTVFLLFYAAKALTNAFSKPENNAESVLQPRTRSQIVLLALGFSILNPHAIIDSLVIIGGGSSGYPNQEHIFLLGVLTSSFIWFSSLTFTARYFSDVLTKANVWKGIELVSGVLMAFIGIKLGTDCLRLISEIIGKSIV
ncbi:LysE family transporter [Fluoribacter dumoffii]|uniref:Arginine exporter protein ArgO n=1 Tax=Fluoribacter dumoffii TaxID=463 RepID=A0A377G5I1_9GAMM|nr:LysE family transporter [Fluoribacter dumoffii]KTC91578.1 transporter, LysE family [Fluoribacter dumoffii NY 23]MCW8387298.1 LysE family transporter [Fluoribacter dumoffii]MCW8417196.1 LysE family transporter [Fluoribacter dumoffii]MCW8454964.1 LysE family transporter [Fluoribacter dumoffii]MCW8460959.1 LysE family transporter [Fluoribacter dumoffii]